MSCRHPFLVDNPAYKFNPHASPIVPVPCGKCPPCLSRRARGWGFRLKMQELVSDSALFITLTYSNDHVRMSENGFMTLCKSDFQKFMKRLRNSYVYRALCPKTKRFKRFYDEVPEIRYYACGEYGSTTMRPHFHAIIYNTDPERIEKAWQLDDQEIGQIHVGAVSGASIGYTTKYMTKGKLIPVHRNDDRLPEFSLMSKEWGETTLLQRYDNTTLMTFPGSMFLTEIKR